ncbi:hypothetical protein FACS189461_1640 [Spirochaetia bacterium]|nr:hypothetical protein FACS189461_1640 [Spirochaetia bacterium]
MQFELTEALINDILFSMEDQEGRFQIDTREGIVSAEVSGEEDDEPDRFIPLPEWESSDGFRLMEHFAASFRNPLIRGDLTRALNQGRGVFRAFKDTLAQYPEAEKRWFAFKDREMKREILRWYNGLREEWGLERIGGEPEETEDLILEDFRFREGRNEDTAAARELHRLSLEVYGKTAEDIPLQFPPNDGVLWSFPEDISLLAETGGGDFAGYITAVKKEGIFYITALEVKDEYRGLGIGEELISRFLESAEKQAAATVVIDLPSAAEGFSQVLLRESFTPRSTRYSAALNGDARNSPAEKRSSE